MSNKLQATNESVQKRGKRGHILYRTLGISWSLVLITVIIFLLFSIPFQRRQLFEALQERAKVAFSTTKQISVGSIILEDYSDIVDHSINMISDNPSLKYIVLTREDDGFSLIHTAESWRQDTLAGIWRPNTFDDNPAGEIINNELTKGRVFHISYPLRYSGIDWGWIHFGLSPETFDKDLRAYYFQALLVTMIAIIVGFGLSFWFARRLSNPIQQLEGFARKIAMGDLSKRVHITTGDEIERLAEAFNQMADDLDRSNREKQTAQKKVVESARQAGMTEMAVDVLHNVGNVLNSVGVTTSELTNKLKHSKIASLLPVANMIKSKGADFPQFLEVDPQGKKLLEYIVALFPHLEAERGDMLKELTALEQHIQHLQDIVRLQQNYSNKNAGLTEMARVHDIIEDALNINSRSINRHRIRVEKKYKDKPEGLLNRHKLLQILTNLISNAKYALIPSDKDKKLISITLEKKNEALVVIRIADNGTGILEDNLSRIFQHGFTTRREGHGFGLHSSAISAGEIGGVLKAESPGKNKGAVFTLELPLKTGDVLNER